MVFWKLIVLGSVDAFTLGRGKDIYGLFSKLSENLRLRKSLNLTINLMQQLSREYNVPRELQDAASPFQFQVLPSHEDKYIQLSQELRGLSVIEPTCLVQK